MKKRILQTVTVVFILLVVLMYLQYGRKEEVTNSFSSSSAGVRDEELTVVANRLFIINKEEYGKELINKALTDSLGRFCFSWDIAIPHAIEMHVYLNKADKRNGTPAFTVVYAPTEDNRTYNVLDNADKYSVTIRD